MGSLSSLRHLTVGDYPRLMTAAALLLTIRVAVVIVTFSKLRRALVRISTAGAVPGSPTPVRITWAVKAADRKIPGERTCLMRSLTTEVLLTLYGYRPEHRIGVDPTDTEFQAHSWLEYDGQILIGELEDLSRFTPLPSLDGDGRQS